MRKLLCGPVIAALLMAAVPAAAQAYHYHVGGTAGALQKPRAYGYVKTSYGPISGNIFDPGLIERLDSYQYAVGYPRRYVWRSAGWSGDQTATVAYSVRYKNYCTTPLGLLNPCLRGTSPYLTAVAKVPMPVGSRGGWVSVWSTPVTPNLGPFGAWIQMWTRVTWRTSNGAFIGREDLYYDQTGDYGCLTVRCGTGISRDVGAYLVLRG